MLHGLAAGLLGHHGQNLKDTFWDFSSDDFVPCYYDRALMILKSTAPRFHGFLGS